MLSSLSLNSGWQLKGRLSQVFRYKCVIQTFCSYISPKIYVIATQKNRLNDRVLLCSQNKCLN